MYLFHIKVKFLATSNWLYAIWISYRRNVFLKCSLKNESKFNYFFFYKKCFPMAKKSFIIRSNEQKFYKYELDKNFCLYICWRCLFIFKIIWLKRVQWNPNIGESIWGGYKLDKLLYCILWKWIEVQHVSEHI